MIKGGVNYSIVGRLYKRGSRSVVMIKITQKVDELLLVEHYNLVMNEYDWTTTNYLKGLSKDNWLVWFGCLPDYDMIL